MATTRDRQRDAALEDEEIVRRLIDGGMLVRWIATGLQDAQQRFLGHDLLGHVPAQHGATRSGGQEATMQLLQQHPARWRPLPQFEQTCNGLGMA